jgi:uncharacterized membrane protein HdeD (DUF308 family)
MNTEPSKRLTAAPWWLVLLQGVASIVVGILMLSSPGITMIVLVRLLGWYWLIKGIFSLTAVFHPEAKAHRGWLILNGLFGILAGIAVLDHPLLSAVFVPSLLVTCIGIVGVIIGINDLLAAFRGAGWSMALLGILSIVLGGVLLGNTLIGVALLPWVIGIAELLGGAVAFVFALRLRAAQARQSSGAESARTA